MVASRNGATPAFGGDWTETKLAILGGYLDFYTTALKKLPFKLVYIDAFAGDGKIDLGSRSDVDPDAQDRRAFIAGSAERALSVEDRAFDRFVFVEAEPERSTRLEQLRRQHRDRAIDVVTGDANEFLAGLGKTEYGNWRGVLFVDPFGTQLDWATVETVARLERLDMWLLFPVSAIGRMLPLSQVPSDVTPAWEACLNRVYGGRSWRELYDHDVQRNLFGDPGLVRAAGVDGLLSIYKHQLKEAFGARFLAQSRTLVNSKNSPLFEFIFCAGSPTQGATRLAKRVANHLLKKW